MDIETILTGSKWDILEKLSEKAMSPTELAKTLNTTIANISQQLRLLQAAGLVKKERARTLGPGKPRMKFSLHDDFAFIIVFSERLAKKKLIRIDPKQKEVLRNIMK